MGKIRVIGIGPGNQSQMSTAAIEGIKKSQIIVGYHTYVDLIKDLIEDQEIVQTGMRGEVERCEKAVSLALEDKEVCVISSGDSGVYGMAGLIIELVEKHEALGKVDVQVIPGITSASASGSIIGAPLMHDFVVLSLSDHLTPLDLIYKRAKLAAQGDFITVLYNPRSKSRPDYLEEVLKIFKEVNDKLMIGHIKNAYREDQSTWIGCISEFEPTEVTMFSTVIIGNSATRKIGKYMVTPRGYHL